MPGANDQPADQQQETEPSRSNGGVNETDRFQTSNAGTLDTHLQTAGGSSSPLATVAAAELAPQTVQSAVDVALPEGQARHYLDATVVPVLRVALRELVKTRPDDPYQWLAEYILSHKPSTASAG
eukprot:jgi/Chrzof1/7532/Cz02g27100.t1